MLIEACREGLIARFRHLGAEAHFLVYDLLPMLLPDCFPPGAAAMHEAWLRSITQADGAVCISAAVAGDLQRWLQTADGIDQLPRRVNWFHLGADLDGEPGGAPVQPAASARRALRPGFLMVGTIEPRKGYLQAIEAFDLLWSRGIDVDLVIVGREGWKILSDQERSPVRRIVERLQTHPELGRRLAWLSDASDDELRGAYADADCLIAASLGEGFGLPLVEAARHGLPVIARDIPAFREIGGEAPTYFAGAEPAALADAVEAWLHRHPDRSRRPAPVAWQSWDASAARLMEILLDHASG
jgi:glycosyltransferase involved in cell wall biosynthesis